MKSLLFSIAVAVICAGVQNGGAAEPCGHIVAEAAPVVAEPPAAAANAPPPGPAASSSGPFHLPPLDSYADVLRRPLFSPDRRAHEPAPAVGAPLSFALRGIVIEADTHYAIVEEGSTIRRLTEGQALGGGMIAKIVRDRVVLNIAGTDRVIRLFEPSTNDEPAPKQSATRGGPMRNGPSHW